VKEPLGRFIFQKKRRQGGKVLQLILKKKKRTGEKRLNRGDFVYFEHRAAMLDAKVEN
jgi:hypothetical protein